VVLAGELQAELARLRHEDRRRVPPLEEQLDELEVRGVVFDVEHLGRGQRVGAGRLDEGLTGRRP